MHPVVLGNEFNDREASGLHPSQWGPSLPWEQESRPGESDRAYWEYNQEEEEQDNQIEMRWSQLRIKYKWEAKFQEGHV